MLRKPLDNEYHESYFLLISSLNYTTYPNEFVTDTSQFFINLVLRDSNVEKILLRLVSPINLLTEIKEKNPGVDIELSAIEKTIKKIVQFLLYSI